MKPEEKANEITRRPDSQKTSDKAGRLLDDGKRGKLCVPCDGQESQDSHACRYSGCTRATLRNSLVCV